MLFIFITKGQLQCVITIGVFCFHLRNYAWTSFNNCTCRLPAVGSEDAGHPNFFSNNSFHYFMVYARQVVRTFRRRAEFNPCLLPTFSFFSTCSGFGSTGSKQTSKGLFICGFPLTPPKVGL